MIDNFFQVVTQHTRKKEENSDFPFKSMPAIVCFQSGFWLSFVSSNIKNSTNVNNSKNQ